MIEILESIKILQDKGYQHDDVKLDNTVLCKDRYKLIDWGKLRSINRVTIRTVFGLNHSPIFLYIYKTKGAVSNIITKLPVVESYDLEKFLITHFDRSLLWMRELLSYPLFQKVNNRVKIELKEIISTKPNPKELLEKYKYTSDIYMFGIAIIYALYKFKINPDKFEPIVEKFTSLKQPVKNAQDAIHFIETHLH
jgi:serine/threonine protein kinase